MGFMGTGSIKQGNIHSGDHNTWGTQFCTLSHDEQQKTCRVHCHHFPGNKDATLTHTRGNYYVGGHDWSHNTQHTGHLLSRFYMIIASLSQGVNHNLYGVYMTLSRRNMDDKRGAVLTQSAIV